MCSSTGFLGLVHSLLFSCFATVLCWLPSLDAMSAPTAERKVRHLLFSSFLFAQLSRTAVSRYLPLSKLILFHPLPLFLWLLVFDVAHFLDLRDAYFLSCFISVLVSQHHEFLPHLVHAGRLKTGVHSFLLELHIFHRYRTSLCVQLHHKHAFLVAHWNSLASARTRRCFPRRQSHSRRSFDVSVQEIHVARVDVCMGTCIPFCGLHRWP